MVDEEKILSSFGVDYATRMVLQYPLRKKETCFFVPLTGGLNINGVKDRGSPGTLRPKSPAIGGAISTGGPEAGREHVLGFRH